MSNKQIDSIFGTPIGLVTIPEDTDILQTHKTNWHRNPDDAQCSWASQDVRVLESYPKIKKILLDHFISFSKVALGVNCNFTISTSWITKCQKGESCHFHSHANCFWSGVYYYGEKYDESSSLAFKHPLNNYIENYGFTVFPEAPTPYNKIEEIITPQKNGLVLFPSYLKHKILKHDSDIPRYSLAFNIVPVGNYGTGDSLYDTKWVT
tara:strand:+ start:108 stop:731 length:624 start_codon:yes stop_codon:yes gene_type:complete